MMENLLLREKLTAKQEKKLQKTSKILASLVIIVTLEKG